MSPTMKRTSASIRTVGLVLLCAYPGGLSAQVEPAPPRLRPPQAEANEQAPRESAELPSMLTIGGGLAVVLGVFFLGAWLLRQVSPAGFGALPREAFEPLGRAQLTARQQVHLLRCGNKALLVSVGGSGAETLTEITDPEEVERLVQLCRGSKRGGGATVFRQAFGREEDGDVR